MAGITGIVLKHTDNKNNLKRYGTAFQAMMKKLAYSNEQKRNTYIDNNICIGNVVPVSDKNNKNYFKSNDLPYHIMIDGLVFIGDVERKILRNKYAIQFDNSDNHRYLPYLYEYYKTDFLQHVTGWFNIVIYDEISHVTHLANDRLGYLPLYYYENRSFILFSSKIESILASGMLPSVEFDDTTFVEHLIFNYPISDHTYIKKLHTLPDAMFVSISRGVTEFTQYWDIGEFFGHKAAGKSDSIEIIDGGLKMAVDKFLSIAGEKFNFSLTGGWDSRVVLSYLLPGYRDRINAYSFGAPGAPDITVPEEITRNEKIDYTPFVLDRDYLENEFLKSAEETILLSNGTRNYKRSHYLYAIKRIAPVSEYLLTGIFGDQVFKVGKPRSGAVMNGNTIRLIESGFNVSNFLNDLKLPNIPDLITTPDHIIFEELKERLKVLENKFMEYETISQKYFAFRFALNLRKYFGNEVNSYNDFVHGLSPFTDYDFLKVYVMTKFNGSRYPFRSAGLKLKMQSSKLYFQIMNRNCKSLVRYNSSRGFSVKDINFGKGILRILSSKIFNKYTLQSIDEFNTCNTHALFLRDSFIHSDMFNHHEKYDFNIEELFSCVYWKYRISKQHNLVD
jgi:asparagine synthetase B (glutamine-hydrolysing)